MSTSTPTHGPIRTARSVQDRALALRHPAPRARRPSPTADLPRRLDPPSSTRCPGRAFLLLHALSRRRPASVLLPRTVRTRARSRTPASRLQARPFQLSPPPAPAAMISTDRYKLLTTMPLFSHSRWGSRRPRRRARSTFTRTEGSPRSRSARSHRAQACTSHADLLRQLGSHRSRLRRNQTLHADHSYIKTLGALPPVEHQRAKHLPLTPIDGSNVHSPRACMDSCLAIMGTLHGTLGHFFAS